MTTYYLCALIKEALQDEAKSFCFDWLARTMTATSSIPAEFNNCDARAASSACSCINLKSTAMCWNLGVLVVLLKPNDSSNFRNPLAG
ncbi:hypothetical protein X797_011586 [Metarhizium robertsii]|uniref:Uncharacterized protein n=1 Tax=Metarhizium robertsii TaxID=568076 RepID=A0A014P1Z7_9HYPO|nr:hypothetical protein X797_011586 [Metarhizium robertsii]